MDWADTLTFWTSMLADQESPYYHEGFGIHVPSNLLSYSNVGLSSSINSTEEVRKVSNDLMTGREGLGIEDQIFQMSTTGHLESHP